jgi:hypothetical protein
MSGGTARATTVRDDWHAPLPGQRGELYSAQMERLEREFAMLSVALNDAFTLRAASRLLAARQQAGCAGELAGRLCGKVLPLLEAVQRGSRWGSRLPAVAPLCPALFRGATARQLASWSDLMHAALGRRSWRFALKLAALHGAVARVSGEFRETAREIADGVCTEPQKCWNQLEVLHDDLNTALGEVFIVLKSFLCAASEEGWAAFRSSLAGEAHAVPLSGRNQLSQAAP